MTWRRDRLPELVREMAGRPRHEALRGHVTEILRSGFDAPYSDIGHEVYLLEGRGRIDTLWGATVVELKSDLRRELGDVLARVPDYLRDGALAEIARYQTDPEPILFRPTQASLAVVAVAIVGHAPSALLEAMRLTVLVSSGAELLVAIRRSQERDGSCDPK